MKRTVEQRNERATAGTRARELHRSIYGRHPCGCCWHIVLEAAAKERARNVAALRKRADYLWSAYGEKEENAVNELRDQADTIEQGDR